MAPVMPVKIVIRNALSGFNPGFVEPHFSDDNENSNSGGTTPRGEGRYSTGVLLASSSTAVAATSTILTGTFTTTLTYDANHGSTGMPHWTPGQASLKNLSPWACLALGVILVVVVTVVGYAVYSCSRSSIVVVTSGRGRGRNVHGDGEGINKEMDNATRTRMRTRNARTGTGTDTDNKAKRRGIAVFCEKAKSLGRFKHSSTVVASHQGRNGRKEQEKKTPPRRWHVTNTNTHTNTSPSPASAGDSPVSLSGYPYSLSYEGDSCSYTADSPNMTLTTPPPAYFRSAHRESPTRRGPTLPSTPSPSSKYLVQTGTESDRSRTGTPVTPPGGGGNGGLFDSHNIRFVMPREKSMERLWMDPKLSPVGGSIIPPRRGGSDSPKPDGGGAAVSEKKGRGLTRI